MANTKRKHEGPWQPVFYETKAGECPAWDFLTSQMTPTDVRIELLTTVRAVLQVGPPRFPTSTQRWRLMHKPTSKPSLVLLGGVVKPVRTEAPQSEYRRINRYRNDYQATHRVALGRGGSEWWPNGSLVS